MSVWTSDAATRPSFQHCVMSLCSSSYSDLGLQLLTDLLSLRSSSYWLVRTELLETLAETDFRCGQQAPRGRGHPKAWPWRRGGGHREPGVSVPANPAVVGGAPAGAGGRLCPEPRGLELTALCLSRLPAQTLRAAEGSAGLSGLSVWGGLSALVRRSVLTAQAWASRPLRVERELMGWFLMSRRSSAFGQRKVPSFPGALSTISRLVCASACWPPAAGICCILGTSLRVRDVLITLCHLLLPCAPRRGHSRE